MTERAWRGSPAAWAAARQAWEETGSFRAAERAAEAAGDPLSRTLVSRRAEAEAWERDGAGGTVRVAGETAARTEERLERAKLGVRERRQLLEERRLGLAESLLTTAERLRDRVHEPATLKEAKVVSLGTGAGSEVEIVEIEVSEATPSQAKDLLIAAAVAVDKAQLLAGEATARTENGPTPAREEAIARIGQIRDELAERRHARDAAEGGDAVVADQAGG